MISYTNLWKLRKISDMPSWATKYKGKNKSLKYLGNDRYGLY